MALAEDLEDEVDDILSQAWDIREGNVVPETESVALAGGAVKLDATMLYADLADSTKIAMYDRRVAARLFKSFLTCCSRIIRLRDGYIRSFDGDRVMGVFVGNSKTAPRPKPHLTSTMPSSKSSSQNWRPSTRFSETEPTNWPIVSAWTRARYLSFAPAS